MSQSAFDIVELPTEKAVVAIRTGLPVKALDGLSKTLGLTTDLLAKKLGISPRTLRDQRKKLAPLSPENTEKVVRIESDTVIRKLRDTIQLSDLQVGDMIVAIGSPGDNGEIDAKLIRDLPPPATAGDGTGTTTQPYQPTATAPQQTQPTP